MPDKIKQGFMVSRPSVLTAASSAVTDIAVMDWCRSIADRISSSMDRSSLRLMVRAYRYFGEHLTIDFVDAGHAEVGIDLHVSGIYRLHDHGGSVPDLVEGLHVAGLIANLLELDATIGDPFTHVDLKAE